MQEKLVIDMRATDEAHTSWAIVDAHGMVRQSAMHDSVDGLMHIADLKQVIVIVPALDVLLTVVRLPKMNRTRLLQAIPFALEEQLIAEVDTLHFAIGETQVNGDLPVAVIAHEKMQHWLKLLQSWSIQPDAFIPASLALPFSESIWQVMLDETAIVRTGLVTGFGCDKNNVAHCLEEALSVHPLPTAIEVQYLDEMIPLSLNVQIKENKINAEQILTMFAQEASRIPAINLLQGMYAVKKSAFPRIDKVWKAATYLTITWVFLLFLYPTVSYFILHQRVSHIDRQIAQIYKRNFPQASSIVLPKQRMQEKLQKLTGQLGDNRFLLITESVGQGLQNTPNIKLRRFDFQNNQMTLELTAVTPEDFSAYTDFLTQQGLSVKQQNASLVESHINATVLIE